MKSKNQKKNEEPEVESEEEINQNRNTIEAEIKIQNREKTKFKKKMSKKINLEKKLSKKELEAGIEEDDLIIKRLERKLGIKKVSFLRPIKLPKMGNKRGLFRKENMKMKIF